MISDLPKHVYRSFYKKLNIITTALSDTKPNKGFVQSYTYQNHGMMIDPAFSYMLIASNIFDGFPLAKEFQSATARDIINSDGKYKLLTYDTIIKSDNKISTEPMFIHLDLKLTPNGKLAYFKWITKMTSSIDNANIIVTYYGDVIEQDNVQLPKRFFKLKHKN